MILSKNNRSLCAAKVLTAFGGRGDELACRRIGELARFGRRKQPEWLSFGKSLNKCDGLQHFGIYTHCRGEPISVLDRNSAVRCIAKVFQKADTVGDRGANIRMIRKSGTFPLGRIMPLKYFNNDRVVKAITYVDSLRRKIALFHLYFLTDLKLGRRFHAVEAADIGHSGTVA